MKEVHKTDCIRQIYIRQTAGIPIDTQHKTHKVLSNNNVEHTKVLIASSFIYRQITEMRLSVIQV